MTQIQELSKPVDKLKTEWQTVRLGDALEEIFDRRGLTPEKLGSRFVLTGHRVISAKHIKENRIDLKAGEDRFVDDETYARWMRSDLQPGDVLLTSEAPLGELAFIQERLSWCLGQRLFGLRPKKELLDGRFLFYTLRSGKARHNLMSRATGTTAQGIRQSELVNVEIQLPSITEQRSIASILGSLDDKIELNRQMNETLEQTAQALFKSWFVDFDPVRAKAEGRETELPKEIADLFPDSFEDSALGKIPKGWRVASFASTVEIIGGGTPKTSESEYWDGDIPWFSVADAPSGSDIFVIDTQKKITQAGIENSSTRLLPEGVTIVTARGTVGKIALVGTPMTMNQSCYGLQGKNKFYTHFSTRSVISELQQHAHGSVFDTITRDTLAGVDVVAPIDGIMDSFDLIVQPILNRIKANLYESRTLSMMRNSLLPELLSGEIRVV